MVWYTATGQRRLKPNTIILIHFILIAFKRTVWSETKGISWDITNVALGCKWCLGTNGDNKDIMQLLLCNSLCSRMEVRFKTRYSSATSMLVTDVGDEISWGQLWDIGDWFKMLVTNSLHWKSHQDYDNITNILKLPPSSSHLHQCYRFWLMNEKFETRCKSRI